MRPGGNITPNVWTFVYNELARSLNVVPRAFDGSDYLDIACDSVGRLVVVALATGSGGVGVQDVNVVAPDPLPTSITGNPLVDIRSLPSIDGRVSIIGNPLVDVRSLPSIDGRVSVLNTVDVSIVGIPEFDVRSLPSINGKVEITALPSADARVGGGAVHGTAAVGNPVRMGTVASDDARVVDEDDITDLWADVLGRQIVCGNAPGGCSVAYKSLSGNTEQEIIAAQGAGTRILVYAYKVTNGDSAMAKLTFKEDSVDAWVEYAAANGGGSTISFPEPYELGSNKALDVQLASTPSTNTVEVVVWFKVLS